MSPLRDPAAEPSDFIRSVGRALQIAEMVGDAGCRGLTVKQIARRCGLGEATTYHLVRSLTYLGYLWRREDMTYTLGTEVAARYQQLVAAYRGNPEVGALLRRAATQTGYTHLVARFVAGRVTITAMSPGVRSPLVEEFVPGFHGAAHATAFGKALLGTLSPDARRWYFKEQQDGMPARTERTLTSDERLDQSIAVAAKRGVHVNGGEYLLGVTEMAVLAIPPAGQDPAALACLLSEAAAEPVGRALSKFAQDLAGLL